MCRLGSASRASNTILWPDRPKNVESLQDFPPRAAILPLQEFNSEYEILDRVHRVLAIELHVPSLQFEERTPGVWIPPVGLLWRNVNRAARFWLLRWWRTPWQHAGRTKCLRLHYRSLRHGSCVLS